MAMKFNEGSELGQAVVTTSARYKILFSQAHWHKLLRLAGNIAANGWATVWIPKRWFPGYAQILGAKASVDFFFKGQWIRNASVGTRPEVTVRDGFVMLRIKVPVGHPLQPDVAAAFRNVLPVERTDMARRFSDAVHGLVRGADSFAKVGFGAGGATLTTGLRLSKDQRGLARLATGRKATGPGAGFTSALRAQHGEAQSFRRKKWTMNHAVTDNSGKVRRFRSSSAARMFANSMHKG